MPNKRKRTGRPAYKARFTSYRSNSVREKNKARRIVKRARSARAPRTVALHQASQNKNPETTRKEVEKILARLGL